MFFKLLGILTSIFLVSFITLAVTDYFALKIDFMAPVTAFLSEVFPRSYCHTDSNLKETQYYYGGYFVESKVGGEAWTRTPERIMDRTLRKPVDTEGYRTGLCKANKAAYDVALTCTATDVALRVKDLLDYKSYQISHNVGETIVKIAGVTFTVTLRDMSVSVDVGVTNYNCESKKAS